MFLLFANHIIIIGTTRHKAHSIEHTAAVTDACTTSAFSPLSPSLQEHLRTYTHIHLTKHLAYSTTTHQVPIKPNVSVRVSVSVSPKGQHIILFPLLSCHRSSSNTMHVHHQGYAGTVASEIIVHHTHTCNSAGACRHHRKHKR